MCQIRGDTFKVYSSKDVKNHLSRESEGKPVSLSKDCSNITADNSRGQCNSLGGLFLAF